MLQLVVRVVNSIFFSFVLPCLALLMMTAESMLSKHPVLRFTAVLFFLIKLFSPHIYCIPHFLVVDTDEFEEEDKAAEEDEEAVVETEVRFLTNLIQLF